jgi:CheY-like chemotaxis protein
MATPVRVLLVDDDERFAELASTYLEHSGDVTVVTEPDAAAGLDRLDDGGIDCVVSDYEMPETDGLTFLESVRADRPDLPFVLFTGKGSEEIAAEAIAAGVTDYLQKGTGTDQYTVLANRIERAVDAYRAERAAARTETDLERREAALREMYRIIAGGDQSLKSKMEDLLAVGCRALDTEIGVVSHVEGDDYEIVAAQTPAGEFRAGDTLAIDQTYCELTMANEETTVFEEVRQVATDGGCALTDRLPYTEAGLTSYIGTPIDLCETTYGTLCFADPEPREEFSEWGRTVVELMGRWLGYELTRRTAKAEIERQRDRLDEFASVVSHDLRSPLSVAQGHLDLARETDDPVQAEHHVDGIETALGRMDELIDDVLGLARRGKRVDETTTVSLAELVTQAWASVEHDGDTTLDRGDLPSVEADRERLRALLENLFRNVHEHTGAEPTVTVGSLPDGGFAVADDGPGVPAGERDSVFRHGYSTSDSGTGFGLSIVETIAQAHGWDVSLAESASGGARFEFRW